MHAEKITMRYGDYGGCYMPESLMPALYELNQQFHYFSQDILFRKKFNALLRNYAGRPTPLTPALALQHYAKGPQVYLKREDQLHTGAHKINNALGQCLLAQQMNKQRIIAETGAGQHGVATATACARLGLSCTIYMGAVDVKRQAPNVAKMRLLGAEVIAVESGSQTLKDAVNAAIQDYAANFASSHYCLGSALGPHPYPAMVAFFQQIIGQETRQQCNEQFSGDPDIIIACIGGGSNAIGIFTEFLDNTQVKLFGVEAGGHGTHTAKHAARFAGGKPGVLHGCYSYLLQDEAGQVASTHSIAAGLDYPMIGPQHALLYDSQRVTYTSVMDEEALNAFKVLTRYEGIIPALESSHALAYYLKIAPTLDPKLRVVINLSGRGDKDLPQLFADNLL